MKLSASKIIFLILVVSVIFSVTTMYYRFYVLNDYEIFYDDYGEGESDEELEEESGDLEQSSAELEINSENIE